MWAKLLNVMLQVVRDSLLYYFPFTLRVMWGAIRTAFSLGIAAGMLLLIAPMFTALEELGLTSEFTQFQAGFELANAWLPLKETLVALAALFTFRAAHAGVKLVERVWESVPLN